MNYWCALAGKTICVLCAEDGSCCYPNDLEKTDGICPAKQPKPCRICGSGNCVGHNGAYEYLNNLIVQGQEILDSAPWRSRRGNANKTEKGK
jgi:hypothetical protein